MNYEALAKAIARPFAQKYYGIFDSNRAELAKFYGEESMLSFDGEKFKGKESILAKLTSLHYQQCQHTITTVDCLPFSTAFSMLVFVTGEITYVTVDAEWHSLEFSQVFQLIKAQGGLYVLSDLFRVGKSRIAAEPQVAEEEVAESVLRISFQ